MQAGSVLRSRSGTGSSRAIATRRSVPCARVDRSLVVARPSCGLVESGGLQRRLDLRPHRDADTARSRVRLGLAVERRGPGRDRQLRRRRDLGGIVSRRCHIRRRDESSGRLFCNNNQWAISTPLSAQTAAPRSPTRRSATGCRRSGSTAATSSPCTRQPGGRRARPSGDGPTFIEAVTYRVAPRDRRRSVALHRRGARQ